MKKNNFFEKTKKKIIAKFSLFLMLTTFIQPLAWVEASVQSGSGNTLSGTNSNFINLSNSGAYQVNFNLSGTLDIGNTLVLTAMDGSGKTSTGTFLSSTGGESSGSLLLDFSASGWLSGPISYNGTIFSGSIYTPIVASGMTLTGTFDITPPVVTLVGSGNISILQGSIYSESGATWTDAIDGTGILSITNSGSVNTSVTGSYLLQYWKVDTAGNASTIVSRTIIVTANPDTTNPIIAITSHLNNALVTGTPTLLGTVSDSGGVASVTVNGALATLGTGSWYKMNVSLSGGLNTINIVATDLSGNTGSTSIVLNRVPLTSGINSTLSGATSAIITFSTDLVSTGVLNYGTGVPNTSITGSTIGTTHSFNLYGLLPDTLYYFTVEGQNGPASSIFQFKTPKVMDKDASGSIVSTGSIYLSGATATGVTFGGSGSLRIFSISSSGSSLSFILNNLTISALGNNWDGVLQSPEMTSNIVNLTLSNYGFTGSVFEIGNTNSELLFSGQLATISVRLGSSLSGQTIRIFRSIDHGTSYTELSTCVVTLGGDCIFTSNRLSLFAFAAPADTTPNTFSFSGIINTELSTQYISNTITLSGMTAQAAISIVGGEYSINSGAYTTLAGSTKIGDTITLRTQSSSSYGTTTNTTLTIGGVSATYSITTKSGNTGGGGGGGGGGGTYMDVCPGGDHSPSYYDGLCITLYNSGTIVTGIFTGSFNIPAIVITNLSSIRFRDIQWNWAKSYIIKLVSRGIVDNVAYYHPNHNLTRAEFLKIVINTAGWNTPTTGLNIPFYDVTGSTWYARYVSLALSRGMIQNSTRFRPNDSISRAEATKILTIALGVTMNEVTTMTFTDVRRTSDLAKYIEAATFLNIVSGQIMNGQRIFRPNDPITRAEIAKVVVNSFHL